MALESATSRQRAGTTTDRLDRRRVSSFRWFTLAMVAFIYMLVAADRVNMGIALPAIRSEFGISNAQAGLFFTFMFSCYAASQFLVSLACRRFGARYIMMAGLIGVAIACYGVGTSSTALEIKIYRSILGVAEASIWVCCISTVNEWFSVRERGTAAGYYWASSKVGPVIWPPIAVIILQGFGWRAIFELFTIPVLLGALVWFFLVQNRPEQSKYVSQAELDLIRDPRPGADALSKKRTVTVPKWIDRFIRLKPVPLVDSVGGIFRSWNLMGNTFATIFLMGIFNVFLAWIPSYLNVGKHLPLTTAGILSSTLFAGAVAGNLLGGWFSDKFLGMRRKPLMMFCALFTSIGLFGLIYVPANEWLLGSLLVVTGLSVGLGYPHFTTYPMSLTTREVYPVAIAVVGTGASISAAVYPFITGLILDNYSWDMVFLFLSASGLICFGFLMTIQEPSATD